LALEINVRRELGFARQFLAHNLAATGAFEEARALYEGARSIWDSLDYEIRSLEAVAGLARVALACDELSAARAYAEHMSTHLKESDLQGADDPSRVYVTCYQVFAALHDARAHPVLQAGGRRLQERAAKISDASYVARFWKMCRPMLNCVACCSRDSTPNTL
jgi:hypothetical protein